MNYKKKAALISVSDKTNVASFAKKLADAGYQIISTGNTAKAIADEGVDVTVVSDVTGFPEIMDGRVKTLHPLIHGGLLGDRSKPDHVAAMEEHHIPDIRIVCVNLYPFEKATESPDTPLNVAIKNIDIGGPAMIRAAAKNFANVTVVCDVHDYDRVAEACSADSEPPLDLRKELAIKAFRHTQHYDSAICAYFDRDHDHLDALSDHLTLNLQRRQALRYGENPHQAAALYQPASLSCDNPLGPDFEQLHGKELSYNNLVDLDAALQLITEFDEPAAAIIKHTNPAGCATSDDLLTAFDNALAGDPISAFGGIVVLNRKVTSELARTLNDSFYEIVSAPGFSPEALEILNKKKNLRIIRHPRQLALPHFLMRISMFGYIVQSIDPVVKINRDLITIPTKRKPTEEEFASLFFAWKVCKHVKSNAIVVAHGTQTLGIGAGQMSRIDSVEIASTKSHQGLKGAVLASDAFFPFRDGPDAAAKVGITAIIQPGGSRRDQEVIDACDEHGLAMVFTGERHFRH